MMTNAHPRALKFSVAEAVAVLAKVLPKFLFKRTPYRVTGGKLGLLMALLLVLALSCWLQGKLIPPRSCLKRR